MEEKIYAVEKMTIDEKIARELARWGENEHKDLNKDGYCCCNPRALTDYNREILRVIDKW